MKILIVDDDPVTRGILIKQLAGLAEISEAVTGESAIASYKSGLENNDPYRIITLDIEMPDMDGFNVLDSIRSIEAEKGLDKTEKTRILMVSSHSDRKTILKCVELGCDDYITKPFQKDITIKKLKKLGLPVHEGEKGDDLLPSKTGNNNKILQRKNALKEIIFRIANRISKGKIDLPVVPEVLEEILDEINNQSTTIEDLANAIRKDPVISLRVITESNSPFYGAHDKINDLKHAIQILGHQETVDTVNSISGKGTYRAEDKKLEILMRKLWLHSLASAYAAELTAEKLELADKERYFFMGIIHDIGKVLLLKVLGDVYQYEDILDMDDILSTIREVHTSLGGAILNRWGLCEDYVRIAVHHPGPGFNSNTDSSVLIINLATYIADYLGYGIHEFKGPIADLDSCSLLEIGDAAIQEICNETKRKMIESSYFLRSFSSEADI